MLDIGLSLCQLLDPLVLADPYPLYQRSESEVGDPAYWNTQRGTPSVYLSSRLGYSKVV